MPAPTKKKNLLILLLITLIVLAAGVVVYFLVIKPSKSQDQVKLSSQQQELVERFGYPTTFILTFGEMAVTGQYQPVRFEAWNYDQLGRRFYFVDGEFQKDIDIDFIDNGQYPKLRPSQFPQDISWEKIKEIIGTSPLAQADIQPEIMEKTTIYDFWGQVKVASRENKVLYIQTFPVVDNEQENEKK